MIIIDDADAFATLFSLFHAAKERCRHAALRDAALRFRCHY